MVDKRTSKVPSVSLFLPVYNFDPKKLEKNVKSVEEYASQYYDDFEVVIVDDSSNVSTKASIDLATISPNVRKMAYDNGPSRRENLAASFRHAKFDVVCYMDIDLSTDLKFLRPLTDKINGGCQVVVGSRYAGITASRELFRLVVSKIYNISIMILFRSNIKDHTCGFKAFQKKVIASLVSDMGYDDSKRRGWFWDAEMLIRAQKMGFIVCEIPVSWKSDRGSTFSLKRELKIVPYILSFLWRMRFTNKT